MNKIKLLALLCFAGVVDAAAQSGSIRLHGKLEKPGLDSMYLSDVSGRIKSIPVAKDGTFNANLPKINKGFYALTEIGNVFLEPGYDLTVAFSPLKGYTFSGKGALENNLIPEIQKSITRFLPVKRRGENYELYDVPVQKYIAGIADYKALVPKLASASKNEFFKRIMIGDADAYTRDVSGLYTLYYGVDSAKQARFYKILEAPGDHSKLKWDSLFNDMYKVKMTAEEKRKMEDFTTEGLDLNNEELYRNSAMYRSLVTAGIGKLKYKPKYSNLLKSNTRGLVELAIINDLLTNPFIKSSAQYYEISNLIKQGGNTALIDSVYLDYAAKVENKAYKKQLEQVYNNYKRFSDHALAPAFDYEQPNGDRVSLTSLLGKYVYIDVWATWCGPCKREIPHLTEIEEKYKNKNIHFVSLSVDVQKDKQKWKDFVADNHLKGIQLIADRAFDADFVKKFNINSIPRFILIDPKGKIVSANAKRPSDPELQKQFDELLN